VKFFLEIYSRKFSRDFKMIDPTALEMLTGYRWPGNIRELKNTIERICIMNCGPSLLPEYLPAEMTATAADVLSSFPEISGLGLEEAVIRFEVQIIKSALEKSGWNVLQAAQFLKIPRGTLRYKMEKMGILHERSTSS